MHPRVERRERGLVVVGGRVVLGQVDDASAPSRRRRGARRSGPSCGGRSSGRGSRRRRRAARGRGRRRVTWAGAARSASRAASGPASSGRIVCSRPRKPGGSDCRRPSIQPATSPWSWLPPTSTSSPSGAERARRGRRTRRRPARPRRAGRSRAARARRRGSRAGRRPPRASSSGARSSGRRSRSERFWAPRWRSETTSVGIGQETRLRARDRRSRPARWPPRRRLLARARGPVRRDDARRPRRRRDQGRAARRRRRHARTGGRRGATARSTYYLGLNRNKRSVALDLGDEADRELARELAARADVLIESFRPGLMASLGPRRRHAARGGQPAARLVLDHRVRLLRARGRRCPATTCCCRRWAG